MIIDEARAQLAAANERATKAEADAAAMRSAARCESCDRPAACVGEYETCGERMSFACDDCCGHGNEDGHCAPIGDAGRALLAERDRLRVHYEQILAQANLECADASAKGHRLEAALGRARAALRGLLTEPTQWDHEDAGVVMICQHCGQFADEASEIEHDDGCAYVIGTSALATPAPRRGACDLRNVHGDDARLRSAACDSASSAAAKAKGE